MTVVASAVVGVCCDWQVCLNWDLRDNQEKSKQILSCATRCAFEWLYSQIRIWRSDHCPKQVHVCTCHTQAAPLNSELEIGPKWRQYVQDLHHIVNCVRTCEKLLNKRKMTVWSACEKELINKEITVTFADCYGFLWNLKDSYDFLLIPMDSIGFFLQNPMNAYGFLWISTESYECYGFLSIPIDSYKFLRIPMDSYGFLRHPHMIA